MIQLSTTELQVLARIAASPDGQVLVQVLKSRLADRDAQLRKLDGNDLHRGQGRAVELAELLEDLTGARKKVEQMQHQRGSLRRL